MSPLCGGIRCPEEQRQTAQLAHLLVCFPILGINNDGQYLILAELRKVLSADSFRIIIMSLRHSLPIMWHKDCDYLILYQFSDNQNMRVLK